MAKSVLFIFFKLTQVALHFFSFIAYGDYTTASFFPRLHGDRLSSPDGLLLVLKHPFL